MRNQMFLMGVSTPPLNLVTLEQTVTFSEAPSSQQEPTRGSSGRGFSSGLLFCVSQCFDLTPLNDH